MARKTLKDQTKISSDHPSDGLIRLPSKFLIHELRMTQGSSLSHFRHHSLHHLWPIGFWFSISILASFLILVGEKLNSTTTKKRSVFSKIRNLFSVLRANKTSYSNFHNFLLKLSGLPIDLRHRTTESWDVFPPFTFFSSSAHHWYKTIWFVSFCGRMSCVHFCHWNFNGFNVTRLIQLLSTKLSGLFPLVTEYLVNTSVIETLMAC